MPAPRLAADHARASRDRPDRRDRTFFDLFDIFRRVLKTS
jgi:hypothetical protein